MSKFARLPPEKVGAIRKLLAEDEHTLRHIAETVGVAVSTVVRVRDRAADVVDEDEGEEKPAPPDADDDESDDVVAVHRDYLSALEAVVVLVRENERLRCAAGGAP